VQRFASRHARLDSLADAGAGAVYFWRRWSSGPMAPGDIHRSVVRLADPPPAGSGSIAVLLDPDGRLLGMQAVTDADSASRAAPDSAANPSATHLWSTLFSLAALDTTRLVPERSEWAAPVSSDTSASWTLPSPRRDGGTWHVHAAAYRGRAVYFSIADSLGTTSSAIQGSTGSDAMDWNGWVNFVMWTVQFLGGIVLARRNLRLGRVDRRGAFRLAAFVFVATALESVFTWSARENGFAMLVDSLLSGRALGHALVHGGQMWVAYVAIEPYVRRLWPRMLVSWARLASGRMRDPMVGRDVLAGLALGGLGVVGTLLGNAALAAAGHVVQPNLVDGASLAAIATPGGMGYGVSYTLSVMVLIVLETLVMCLLVHLVTRNDRLTFLVAGAVTTLLLFASQRTPELPWPVIESVLPTVVIFVALFRFGLLTALACQFALSVLPLVPPVLDGGTWYGMRGLLVLIPFGALAIFAAWNALAGQPLLADVLQERRPARG